jgi:2-polyprenyl-6-methoxyphenol hydroxylase-like FAD-dependent oxidoreductase
MSTEIRRVLVVGAGIGGLGAGVALARKGIEVRTVELRPQATTYGVGINQPGNSLRALDALGVLDEVCAVGFQFDGWSFHDAQGNLVVHVDNALGGHAVPNNNGLSRRDLHTILIGAAQRAGVTVDYDVTVADLVHDGDRVHVKLSDGSEDDADLVVAFDGIKSPMRRRLFGDSHEPVFTGCGVWRLTVPRPAEVTDGALFQAVGAKAGYIPLSKDSMYLLLVTPEAEGVHYDESRFADMLRERLAPFGGIIGDIRDAIRDGDDIVYGPLSEVMVPPPWHRGRVLVCGDAVHACTPHLTQGAAMALEDAVVLAEELARARPVEEMLTAFVARRHPRAKVVQDASRAILDAEMSITAETIDGALEYMRAALPGQFRELDAFLSQPA